MRTGVLQNNQNSLTGKSTTTTPWVSKSLGMELNVKNEDEREANMQIHYNFAKYTLPELGVF